jgi:single-strand DNA-binding protein
MVARAKESRSKAARAGSAGSKGKAGPEPSVNEVRLVGRLSQDPQARILPSGDQLWTFRVVVARTGPPVQARATVDALECAVWSGRCRRTVATWRSGDVVEVTGALRRRFFRTGAGVASRVEVEVATAKLIRRPPSA